MTTDEALERIGQGEHCFVVWDNATGEILSVTAFAHKPTPAQMMQSLQQMQAISTPVKGRFFESGKVTRLALMKEAAQTAAFNTRGRILTEWSHLPVDDLMTLLEDGVSEPPMGVRDSHIIIDHLWEVHRDELAGPMRDRLRALLGTDMLHDDVERKLRVYLAGLDGDERYLKAVWTGDVPGRECWADAFAIMEAMAHIRTRDQDFIDGMLAIFDLNMPFGGKYDTMISLGRIGSAAGARAATVIRANVFDSEPRVIAARDRVLERLEKGADWPRCAACCYGCVHGEDTFGERPCPECLGLGWRPVGVDGVQGGQP